MQSLNALLAQQIVDDRTAEAMRRGQHPRLSRPRRRWRRSAPPAPETTSIRDLMALVAQPVTVVTGLDPEGAPAGMTVSSFTSVSADPPIVLFCPSRASRTWASIAPSGRFVVNVLASHQQDVAEHFSGSAAPFSQVSHRIGIDGLPVLAGTLAAARCTTAVVRQGGDHHVVLARLDEVDRGAGAPLTYWSRRYATVNAP
jgi:3-hydroxy-9,10-secoandrosta-1,3,5(10)-triene-9,17-dione monooxygenase reductase component